MPRVFSKTSYGRAAITRQYTLNDDGTVDVILTDIYEKDGESEDGYQEIIEGVEPYDLPSLDWEDDEELIDKLEEGRWKLIEEGAVL